MPDDTKHSTDPERREYHKHYQREFRRRKRRADIMFDPDEYERIKRAATRHNMKLAPFMRACIHAYLEIDTSALGASVIDNGAGMDVPIGYQHEAAIRS